MGIRRPQVPSAELMISIVSIEIVEDLTQSPYTHRGYDRPRDQGRCASPSIHVQSKRVRRVSGRTFHGQRFGRVVLGRVARQGSIDPRRFSFSDVEVNEATIRIVATAR